MDNGLSGQKDWPYQVDRYQKVWQYLVSNANRQGIWKDLVSYLGKQVKSFGIWKFKKHESISMQSQYLSRSHVSDTESSQIRTNLTLQHINPLNIIRKLTSYFCLSYHNSNLIESKTILLNLRKIGLYPMVLVDRFPTLQQPLM